MTLSSNPEAVRARTRNAIKRGVLERPGICEECRKPCKPQAAHYDYSRAFDVRWLCARCHTAWDHADPKGGVDPNYRTLSISVNPAIKAQVQAVAQTRGTSVAGFIRAAIDAYMARNHPDLVIARVGPTCIGFDTEEELESHPPSLVAPLN